ncbi:MAG TPA: PCP reductase family protein [Thermoanaerobaculia bacterium]|nr:PCP reductase family protein [Thermoanaerobaculia bacterium]
MPDFVRPMARQGIEHYAKSSGYAEIDERVPDEARQRFGM